MGHYFVMLLAVLMFAAQFSFTKVYGELVAQKTSQTLIMMIFISIIGTVMYLIIGGFRVSFSPYLIFWAVAFAATMIPYYVLGIHVLSIGSVAIYSMFMMLGGMLLPFVYGVIFLDEPLTLGKGIGCVVLTAAIFLQAMVQNSDSVNQPKKGNKKGVFILLCIAIFILNGLTAIIAKAYLVADPQPDEVGFTVVSCFLTALFSLLMLIPTACKKPRALFFEIKSACKPSLLLCMTAIGIATYTGNFLQLKAAAKLPASVQFPMVSGGVIVFSAIASAKIFKEKISTKELFCIIAACASTVLFAF